MKTFEEEKATFLAHAGVKGMRWGHRKPEESGSSAPKLSRKEKRVASREADMKKAEDLIKTSVSKGNDVMIKLNGATVMTGKEFVDHMTRGGYMNVKTTSIYAELNKERTNYILSGT